MDLHLKGLVFVAKIAFIQRLLEARVYLGPRVLLKFWERWLTECLQFMMNTFSCLSAA